MKINKIFLLLAAMMFVAVNLKAQNVTTPYSMYGYGIINDHATSTQRQMGGVGYAMNSGRQINVKNPASYASVDSLTFLWDMGADITFLNSRENGVSENSVGGGLDYITMQFPISKYMGASVGLVPYSSVGYAFGNDIKNGAMQNQGSGGINEAYIGFAGKYAGVSLGFNVSYSFGNIFNDVYSYPTTTTQTLFEHVMQVRDWNINIGAQYTAKLDKFNKMTLGVTYSPKKTMLGNTWATIQDLDKDSRPDTVGYMSMKGKYYQPNTIGVGLSYTHDRHSHFMVEADVTYQDWSKAKYSPLLSDDGDVLFYGLEFNDRYKYAVGAEYTPKIRGNYVQRITYRFGGYYTQDYLKISGNNVKDYGLTCGVGLPTPEGKTLINIGFEWHHRNSSPVSMLTENYYNITIGLNFNELWFWQRKIR